MENYLQDHKELLNSIRKIKRKLTIAEIALNKYVYREWPTDTVENILLMSLSSAFSELHKLQNLLNIE